MTFFQTNPSLSRALTERNYADPTPVQSAVLAPEAAGRDLLVSAQTGSGKTVAYGLGMAPTILGEAAIFGQAAAPLALVIAPTRELAMQVERELTWLYQYTQARIAACVGGMDSRQERRRLAEGVHIVVGTPGRLRDHIERGGLDLSRLKAVVLDEADEMLDLGFREDLEFILDAAPADKRSLLFSATMPKAIAALAKRYQRDALRIEVAGGKRGHVDIEYRAIRIAPKEAEHAVVNLLRLIEAPTAIVFCNTREAVRHLHATLLERGFSAVLLSGELSQHERNQAMQALRNGRARVCVATDVAARGIDLPNVGIVIHADLPHDVETLQHRSGRTGRAGRKGVSALLVPIARRRRAEQLFANAGIPPQWSGPPSADEIRLLDQERLLQDPLLTEPPNDDDIAMAKLLLARRSAEEVAAALARIYRSRLPALEEISDPGHEPERREPRQRPASPRNAESYRPPERKARDFGKPHAFGPTAKGVWFRLDIGRSKNADPKWLLPMICRAGGLTKADIGTIRIFDNETKFEVAASAAEQFASDIRRRSPENIRIEPLDDQPFGAGFEPRAKGAARKRGPRPLGKKERLAT
ncbi:DEAD/DEAH box helicase [Methylocapsa sp. S129]|uniref:DEAD/DEAH box helicase n=1 Tax=Methylocapsa sp. S129 TaxID=1641869 RepID=UPI00131EBB68|nr:DEAD/DEAH box helicase [Methylocapsa sp. S129]